MQKQDPKLLNDIPTKEEKTKDTFSDFTLGFLKHRDSVHRDALTTMFTQIRFKASSKSLLRRVELSLEALCKAISVWDWYLSGFTVGEGEIDSGITVGPVKYLFLLFLNPYNKFYRVVIWEDDELGLCISIGVGDDERLFKGDTITKVIKFFGKQAKKNRPGYMSRKTTRLLERGKEDDTPTFTRKRK